MEERILSLTAVREATSLGRTSIYSGVSAGTFPKPVKLTARRVGWLQSSVRDWIAARATNARAVAP